MENSRCPKIYNFCLLCGHIVIRTDGKSRFTPRLTPEFKLSYTPYFDEIDPSGEDYTPNTVCGSCYTQLLDWYHHRGRKLNFIKPLIWLKDPQGHVESRCYSCVNYIPKLNKQGLKSKNT